MSTDDKPNTPPTAVSAEAAISQKTPVRSTKLLWLAILILILVTAAEFSRVFILSQQMTTVLANFSRQIETDRQQIAGLQDKWITAEHQLQQQEETMQRQLQTAQQGSQILPNGTSARDYSSVLAAQYWVQLASNQLFITGDVSKALRLLNQAAALIDPLTYPQVLPIKKALAQDLATLKSLPWVNTDELYLNLSSLQKQIEKMPVLLVPAQETELVTAPTTVPHATGWENGLQNVWRALRQIVVVYHLPKSKVPPFITPDQQPYIYQNLYATLNEVRWAVLHRDTSIYSASLQQAIEWIHQYFLPNSPQTKAVLTELLALQSVSMQPAKDVVLASPKMFQDYLR